MKGDRWRLIIKMKVRKNEWLFTNQFALDIEREGAFFADLVLLVDAVNLYRCNCALKILIDII